MTVVNAKYIGRGAARRMTASIGAAVLVVIATVVPASAASSSDELPPDRTALIMGGTTIPTWHDADVKVIMNQFIAPTHPGQTIEPVAVTTPEEAWLLTGVFRLLGLALGPPSIFGPGGSAWPDEPWWKISGLFDLDYEQSIRVGVTDLETAMTKYGNDPLVIYGYSQGAMIAIREKRKLAAQYPGTTAPDIDFVLSEDLNLPNGGILARFPGLYIPILGIAFNGAEPTDTPFRTTVITRQYDGLADFPLYPLNLVADLNAVLGVVYRHLYPFDVSLAPDPSTSRSIQSQHGDTSYYLFETQDLPLFSPLRTLGVPESVIDVVEPFFRVVVELGYDRSIQPWVPTPARLIPKLDPATVAADLVNAIGEGINNAAALIGRPAPLSIPASVTVDQGKTVEQVASDPESTVETASSDAGSQPPQRVSTPAPATADKGDAVEHSGTLLDTTPTGVSGDVSADVSPVPPAVDSQLPKPRAVTHDDLDRGKRTVRREPTASIGNGRETTARPERKTSMRDAVTGAGSLKQSLTRGHHDRGGDRKRVDEAE